jgi:MFS family permease
MMVKKFGANIVLAIALFGWSSVTLGTAFITNYTQALVMRVLLGLFEAALFPCLAFVVSTVYSRQKQAKRIAVLYGGAAISGAFGGLIAYGIQIRGERNGLAAWRWLFIVEGIISFVVAICIWFTLPRDATKAWFLKPEEREVMRLRRQRDAEYTGDDEFSWEYVRMAFSDPLIYIAAIAFFCATVPFFGFATFLPTIIQGLG